MTDYAVVIEQADDGGWWAHAPDLPGVVAAADTPEDAQSSFREALEFYREELQRSGKKLPVPRSKAAVVSV